MITPLTPSNSLYFNIYLFLVQRISDGSHYAHEEQGVDGGGYIRIADDTVDGSVDGGLALRDVEHHCGQLAQHVEEERIDPEYFEDAAPAFLPLCVDEVKQRSLEHRRHSTRGEGIAGRPDALV